MDVLSQDGTVQVDSPFPMSKHHQFISLLFELDRDGSTLGQPFLALRITLRHEEIQLVSSMATMATGNASLRFKTVLHSSSRTM